ncbi:MAG: c-type cytochrome [Steroidobacteraceae bacterium]
MLLVGIALVIGAAGSASAAGIAQIVHARQEHLRTMGRLAKSLRDQIWRSHPNWNVVVNDANEIEQLASALPRWFPAGSGKGHGIKTRASAAIWAKPQEFAQAAQRLLKSSQDLAGAAARHDRRALALRSRELGRTCGSCHREFRARSSWW